MTQTKNARSFDEIWQRIDSQSIKRITRQFGGKSTWRRDECAAYLRSAFNEPARVRAAVKNLPLYQYNLLRFIKEAGGEIKRNRLKMLLYASGVNETSKKPGFMDAFQNELHRLLTTGLAFNRVEYGSPTQLHDYYSYQAIDVIYSDDRVLEHVDLPEYQPVTIQPVPEPANPVSRPPHLVTMQLISLLNAVDHMNGVKMTMDGRPRATEVRKLAKQLGWENEVLSDGSLQLGQAANLFLRLFQNAQLLANKDHVLQLTPLAREFGSYPAAKQVWLLLQGMYESGDWQEYWQGYSYFNQGYGQARTALVAILRCLPQGPESYYRVDDLDIALFNRIGEFFSLRGSIPRFYNFDQNPKIAEDQFARWIGDRRGEWLKSERLWLDNALTTWLYFLGIVSLDLQKGKPAAVGLTEFGRSAISPEALYETIAEEPANNNGEPAWVVQPNFDIIAYLNRLNTAQLAFLERHAERIRAQEHIAEYRLTRESVYRGLEMGSTPEEVVEGLRKGSGKELAQNIAVEIKEWAALRERITLFRNVQLAEFPNPTARDAALKAGLTGTPVGDRFLILTKEITKSQARLFSTVIDNRRGPRRTLSVDEAGNITFQEPSIDLVLNARLQTWAESDGAGTMKLTKESIRKAVAAGHPVQTLLRLLDEHAVRLLPPILRLALTNWSGQASQIALGRVLMLRSPSPEVSYALHHSTLIRKYLRGTIAPGYFLVNEKDLEALRAQLEAFGLEVILDSNQPGH